MLSTAGLNGDGDGKGGVQLCLRGLIMPCPASLVVQNLASGGRVASGWPRWQQSDSSLSILLQVSEEGDVGWSPAELLSFTLAVCIGCLRRTFAAKRLQSVLAGCGGHSRNPSP